jgi:hypothetical protein
MAEKQIMIREEVVAMTVDLILSAWAALDLNEAKLRPDDMTLHEMRVLMTDLKTVWNEECGRKLEAERRRAKFLVLKAEAL